jgi:MFS family permease
VLVLGASGFWQHTALIVVWTAWLQGIGFGLMWSAAVPYLSELTPLHLKSTAQGCLYAAFFGVGNAAGSYIGGIVYEHFGARAMFLDATIVLLLGTGVFAVEELVTTRCISSR